MAYQACNCACEHFMVQMNDVAIVNSGYRK